MTSSEQYDAGMERGEREIVGDVGGWAIREGSALDRANRPTPADWQRLEANVREAARKARDAMEREQEQDIAAMECSECEVAIQLRALDGYGAEVATYQVAKCPLCGNETLHPITRQEYTEKFEESEGT